MSRPAWRWLLRLAGEARDVAARLQDPSGDGMYWAFVTSLVLWIGEVPGARATLDWLATHFAGDLPISAAAASRYLALVGEREQAAAWLDRLRPRLADLARDLLWMATLALCGEAAAVLGDRPVAQRCYDLLAPHAGYYLNAVTAVYSAVPRVLGVIAQALGDLDRATATWPTGPRWRSGSARCRRWR